MASLRKRNGTYYIVFARRLDGKLEQKAFSLGIKRKAAADRLKVQYQEQYALGEINPFNGWSPSKEIEKLRAEQSVGTTLEEMAELFLQQRSHVRERTLKGYRWQLDKLIEEVGRTMPVHLITDEDVRAYCFKPGYSTATQTTYLRFCKMFFKWLKDAGFAKENVCERIKYPKQNQKTSGKIISEDQLHQIFAAFKAIQRRRIKADQVHGLHVWFKPMIAMFFYAGLRRREGVNLTWDKVDLAQGYIHVSGTKSGKERVVPIRKTLKPFLVAWHRYSGYPEHGLVFFKEIVGDGAVSLTGDNVSKTFKKYARAARLPESVNLHGLRHSCATELLRLGMGINEVASILGHSSLEITRIYEHLNERDLKLKMEKLGI